MKKSKLHRGVNSLFIILNVVIFLPTCALALSCQETPKKVHAINLLEFKKLFNILFKNKKYNDKNNKLIMTVGKLSKKSRDDLLIFDLKLNKPKRESFTQIKNIVIKMDNKLFLLEHPVNTTIFDANLVYGFGVNGLAIFTRTANEKVKSYYWRISNNKSAGLQCYFNHNNQLVKTYRFLSDGSVAS